jgi:hypothetical protein
MRKIVKHVYQKSIDSLTLSISYSTVLMIVVEYTGL